MRTQQSRQRKRSGRPPAGAQPGEKVLDYPQISVRVPPDVKQLLNDLSSTTGLPQWRVVSEALRDYADRIAGLIEIDASQSLPKSRRIHR